MRSDCPGVAVSYLAQSVGLRTCGSARSIGRFLEHAGICYFANGRREPLESDFYVGSADWTYRNLSRRAEAAHQGRELVVHQQC